MKMYIITNHCVAVIVQQPSRPTLLGGWLAAIFGNSPGSYSVKSVRVVPSPLSRSFAICQLLHSL